MTQFNQQNKRGGKRPNAGLKPGMGKGNQNAHKPLGLRSVAKMESPPISAEGLRKRLKRQNKTLEEYIAEKLKNQPKDELTNKTNKGIFNT